MLKNQFQFQAVFTTWVEVEEFLTWVEVEEVQGQKPQEAKAKTQRWKPKLPKGSWDVFDESMLTNLLLELNCSQVFHLFFG